MTRKVLLACGIVSSLLYIAMNVIVAMQWQSYSSFSQTVSELSAIGAPTRRLWVIPGVAYTVLVLAFGYGVRRSAQNLPLLWVIVLAALLLRPQADRDGTVT